MKLSQGFHKLLPSIFIFIFYALSFVALTFAVKKLEISVSYAIWSGVGTALITLIGVFYFNESVTALKLVSLALIITGVVGLNLSQPKV